MAGCYGEFFVLNRRLFCHTALAIDRANSQRMFPGGRVLCVGIAWHVRVFRMPNFRVEWLAPLKTFRTLQRFSGESPRSRAGETANWAKPA
jgi:hypothetical protein